MAGAEGIRMGKAFVEIGAKTTELEKNLQTAAKKVETLGKKIQDFTRNTSLFFAAKLTASIALTKQFASLGDTLDKMSIRTGVSAQTLSEWGFVASRCGSELAEIEALMYPLAEKIHRSDEEFQKWGMSIEYLKSLTPEEQFLAVADAIKRLSTESEQAAAATALFGGAGEKLLPMLKLGAAGILELQKEGKKLGATLSKEDATAAAELTDAYYDLSVAARGVATQLGIALTPAVLGATDAIAEGVAATAEWVKENHDMIAWGSNAFTRISLWGVGVYALGTALRGLGTGLHFTGSAFRGVGVASEWTGKALSTVATVSQTSISAFRESAVIAGMNAIQLRAWGVASEKAVQVYSHAARGIVTQNASLIASEEFLTRVGLIKNRSMMTSMEIARRNAASILFMSQAEFRATAQMQLLTIARKAWNAVASVPAGLANLAIQSALTVRQVAYNAALLAGVGIQKLWTHSLRTDAAASSQTIVLRTLLAAKNAICAASTFVLTAATQGLTVAVAGLGLAILSIPHIQAIAMAAAIIAVLGTVAWSYMSAAAEARKFAEATKKASETREKGDETRRLDNMKLERLRQLSEKQQLTNAEMAEAKELTKDLESRYGKLGIRLDRYRQKVELAANAQNRLNREMQQQAINALKSEQEAIEKQKEFLEKRYRSYQAGAKGLTSAGNFRGLFSLGGWNPLVHTNVQMRDSTASEIGALSDREVEIRKRLRALQQGDENALTAHSEEERLQKAILAEKTGTETASEKELENAAETSEKPAWDWRKTADELETIDREKRTEQQQERYELQKKFELRKKLLDQSVQELEAQSLQRDLTEEEWTLWQKITRAREELYREEMRQLDALEAKERRRRRELQEQEAEKFRSLKKEIQDEKLTREKEALAAQEEEAWKAILKKVEENPKLRKELQKQLDREVLNLQESVQQEEAKLNRIVTAAEKDKKLTPEEVENIQNQRHRLRLDNDRLQLWEGRRDELNVSGLQNRLQQISFQDAYFRGDVQTRRQAAENAQRLQNPPKRKGIDDYAENIWELLKQVANLSNRQLRNTAKQFVVEVH